MHLGSGFKGLFLDSFSCTREQLGSQSPFRTKSVAARCRHVHRRTCNDHCRSRFRKDACVGPPHHPHDASRCGPIQHFGVDVHQQGGAGNEKAYFTDSRRRGAKLMDGYIPLCFRQTIADRGSPNWIPGFLYHLRYRRCQEFDQGDRARTRVG